MGTAIGFFMSDLIVGKEAGNIGKLNLTSLVISIVPLVMTFLMRWTTESRPRVPKKEYQEDLNRCLNFISTDKNYLMMTVMFSFAASNCWSYVSVVNNYLSQANLTSLQIGSINIVYTLSGSVLGLLFTYFLDRYQRQQELFFDHVIKVLMVLMFIATFYFAYAFQSLNFVHHLVINAIMGSSGICLVSFLSVAIIENTYPYSESITTNGLFFLGNIASLLTTVISIQPQWIFNYTYVISMVPTLFYVLFFYKTTFRKTQALILCPP